jgi:replication factor C large subunit
MFDLIRHVLKGRKLDDVRREVWDVDATPEDLALWVDENLAKEYKDPNDLVRGYHMLSRADIFLGRTKRTQNYGLWSYAGELATLGVMTSRQREYSGFVPFGFPQWLSKMGRTKGSRQAKDELALVLGRSMHTSKRKARQELVEAFMTLFQNDREFAVEQATRLGLDDEQVALLLGDTGNAKAIKELRAEVDTRAAAAFGKAKAADDGKTPSADEDDEPEAEDEAPKRPTPKPGQKGLFGF